MLFCSRNHCQSTIYLSCIQLHEFQKHCKRYIAMEHHKIFTMEQFKIVCHGKLQKFWPWKVTYILQWNVTKVFCCGRLQIFCHGMLQNISLWKVTKIFFFWKVTKYLPWNVIKIIVMVSWSLNDH